MSTQASAPPLVVRTGEGERSLAAGRAYLVGRDPQADIVVADFRVSWHHAELRAQNGRWALADLGSSNGSYADGRRADLIEIDGTRQVRLGDPEDGPLLDSYCATRGRTLLDHTGRPGTAHRPGAGQRHRGPPPQRLPPPRRAAHDAGRVPHRGPGQPQRHLRQRAAGHRGARWPRGTPSASATPRSGWPAASCSRSPTRRRRRCRPRPTPWPKPGSGLPQGGSGGRAAPPRAGGSPGGSPPRRQALSRPRSRTRCAGWCRGASGSRTSTS